MTPSPGGPPPGQWAPPTGPPSAPPPSAPPTGGAPPPDAPPTDEPPGGGAPPPDAPRTTSRRRAEPRRSRRRPAGRAASDAPSPRDDDEDDRPSGRRASSRAGPKACEARPRRGRRAPARGGDGRPLPAAAARPKSPRRSCASLAAEAADDPSALARAAPRRLRGRSSRRRRAARCAAPRGEELEARLATLAASVPEAAERLTRDPRRRPARARRAPLPGRTLAAAVPRLLRVARRPAARPRLARRPVPGRRGSSGSCSPRSSAASRRRRPARDDAPRRASRRAAEAATAARRPRALERRAAEAEAAGDLEAALRLRFRAGLLRLDARGAIDYRPSISTREVRRDAALGGLRHARRDVRRRHLRRPGRRGRRRRATPASAGPPSPQGGRRAMNPRVRTALLAAVGAFAASSSPSK